MFAENLYNSRLMQQIDEEQKMNKNKRSENSFLKAENDEKMKRSKKNSVSPVKEKKSFFIMQKEKMAGKVET